MKVHLRTGEGSGRLYIGHSAPRPAALPVVEQGSVRAGGASVNQMANTVTISHQLSKSPVKRILSVGVKVGRTVRIRKGSRGEGMGHQVVYAPDQEVIRQKLLFSHPRLPSVSPEVFTQAPSLLFRIHRSQRGSQLSTNIVVKAGLVVNLWILPSGGVFTVYHHLAADVVDSRHVLAGKPPKVVSQTDAQIRVEVAVLQHVADVLHAVIRTPPSDLFRKALLHQTGGHLHKTDSLSGLHHLVSGLSPEIGKIMLPSLTSKDPGQSFSRFP